MKSLSLVVAAGLVVASMFAFAYTPGAGIMGSAHDWSSAASPDGSSGGISVLLWLDAKGNQTQSVTGTPALDGNGKQLVRHITIGQCSRCHTLHQAISTNLLWNHTLNSSTYKWDQPATTAGTTYPTFKGDTYKGPSPKCLSCHDGSIASTGDSWFNRGFIRANPYSGAWTGYAVASTGGGMSGTHPVAMPYPLGGIANTYNGVINGNQINTSEWVADPKATNGVRLFVDDGTGNITAGTLPGKTGIECTSCHDVHNGSRVKDAYLVTGKISSIERGAGGYICTQCHAK